MSRVIPIRSVDEIPPGVRETPVARLLEYHNLGFEFQEYEKAQMLIGMCIDNRKYLRIPNNFAFIIRTGGANLRYSEFKISFCIAVGGVRQIAVIGHTGCGMVSLMARKDQFIKGLVEAAGWDEARAQEHFMNYVTMFEIDNAVEFTLSEARRLAASYPGIAVCPLFYSVEDNRLAIIADD